MYVNFDADALKSSLADFEKEVTRKLTGMVQTFAFISAVTAIDNTPLGDSMKYEDLYLERQKNIGLQPIEGFAKGSWRVSTDGTLEMQELYGQNSDEMAESIIKQDLQDFKLGDTIMISNFGPYIKNLDVNYERYSKNAPILAPTIESIMGHYQFNLDDYYNRS